jgi:hypothetical protein
MTAVARLDSAYANEALEIELPSVNGTRVLAPVGLKAGIISCNSGERNLDGYQH